MCLYEFKTPRKCPGRADRCWCILPCVAVATFLQHLQLLPKQLHRRTQWGPCVMVRPQEGGNRASMGLIGTKQVHRFWGNTFKEKLCMPNFRDPTARLQQAGNWQKMPPVSPRSCHKLTPVHVFVFVCKEDDTVSPKRCQKLTPALVRVHFHCLCLCLYLCLCLCLGICVGICLGRWHWKLS